MKEFYLLIRAEYFPRGSFRILKDQSLISNNALSFYFLTPDQLNSLDSDKKFVDVIGSNNFIEFASFDSKHAFKYFKRKVGKVSSNGILKKLAKSRKQSGR